MEFEQLTSKIIGAAIKVHSVLGPGFLESVYQNSLLYELHRLSLQVECNRALTVHYDGVIVGSFSADMVVESIVLIENKAVQTISPQHEVQLVNYLTATGLDVGLLLNFGSTQLQFKRKHRIFRRKNERQDEQDLQDERKDDRI